MKAAFLGFLLLFLAGCATSPGGDQPTNNRNLITREQIAEAGRANLLDVVQVLKPEWLVLDRRQRLVRILLDDDPHSSGSGEGFLTDWTPKGIIEMEYLTPPEARLAFPEPYRECGAGIIIVRTRPRGNL
jgi:hypothetical protein